MPGPALFDHRQIRYTFARKPGAILRCARVMLGVSPEDVLGAMKGTEGRISLPRYKTIEGDLDGHDVGAIEWIRLCECLGLSVEFFRAGYCARWHLTKVRGEIEQGEFRIPLRLIFRKRLAAFEEWEAMQMEAWRVSPRQVIRSFRSRSRSGTSRFL